MESVPLIQLNRDQLNFLSQLGIIQEVGEEGILNLENNLYKNVLDLATSAKNILTSYQNIINGVSKSDQIKSGLTGLVVTDEYDFHNEILMRVSFTGNAAMANIVDFKTWGAAWHDIGRGIAMANNAAPEDIRIVGATKGSIVIELAVIAKIAATASGIILAALKVAEKVLDIKRKAEEIRGLKLANDKLADEIEKAADTEKSTGISEISKQTIVLLNLNESTEGDKIKALETSVKHLVNFIERGGIVDFVIADEAEDEAIADQVNSQELRLVFEQIRQIEKKLELIEHKID